MDTYTLNICGLKRELPFVPISEGEMAFASFVMIADTELIGTVAKALLERMPECDYIVCPEAKAIALSYELSRLLQHPEFIVARKSVKSYMKDPLQTSVHSITTTQAQSLYLDRDDVEKLDGKRVCIVDDVISTGESLAAVENLLSQTNARIVGKVAVLAEGNAANRNDIIFLEKLPLFQKIDSEWKEI